MGLIIASFRSGFTQSPVSFAEGTHGNCGSRTTMGLSAGASVELTLLLVLGCLTSHWQEPWEMGTGLGQHDSLNVLGGGCVMICGYGMCV